MVPFLRDLGVMTAGWEDRACADLTSSGRSTVFLEFVEDVSSAASKGQGSYNS